MILVHFHKASVVNITSEVAPFQFAYIRTYVHTCIRTYIHTYIHTYMHARTHTHTHTHTEHACMHTDIRCIQYIGMHECAHVCYIHICAWVDLRLDDRGTTKQYVSI